MPIWTGTSTTSGNSIQVIQYLCVRLEKHVKLLYSTAVNCVSPFLCLVHSNSASELPALMIDLPL